MHFNKCLKYIVLIWIGFIGLTANSLAETRLSCQECEQKARSIAQHQAKIDEAKRFLGKNEEYLARLSGKQAAMLKVSENKIVIIEIIQQNEKEIARINDVMNRGECVKCPGGEKNHD